VDADAKSFVRRVSRQLTGFKLTSGTPAKAQARRLAADLRTEFGRRGIGNVTYANGARHSFGEYAEMLLRTKTGVAYNQGTLNHSRANGIQVFEILDGSECGLTSHYDPEKANGRLVTLEFAQAFPLAHPNCRRAIAPRPDVASVDEPGVRSVVSDEARKDQTAFEQALKAQTAAKRAGLDAGRAGRTGRSGRPGRPDRPLRATERRGPTRRPERLQGALSASQARAEMAAKVRAQNAAIKAELQALRPDLDTATLQRAFAQFERAQLAKVQAFDIKSEANNFLQAQKVAAQAKADAIAAAKAKKSAAAKKAAATRARNKAIREGRLLADERPRVKMPEKPVPQGWLSGYEGTAQRAIRAGRPAETIPVPRKMEATLQSWLDSLTQAEANAVTRYTGSDYRALNQVLWELKGDISKLDDRGRYRSWVADLKSALDKHPIREEPVTTWRGLRSHPSFIPDMPGYARSLKPGDVIVQETFGSSSLQPAVAENFASWQDSQTVIYKITTHKAPNIIAKSGIEAEAEVLFSHGAMFRVVKPFDPVTKILELEEVY
jgi:hypothetical protein